MPYIQARSGLFDVPSGGSNQQTPVGVVDSAQLRTTRARQRRRSRGRRKDLKVDFSAALLHRQHDTVFVVVTSHVAQGSDP
ncbi:hypothetical protein ACFX11_024303 [Malus domestica]